MSLHPADFIRKKRDKQTLTSEDIQAFFGHVASGEVKDYQATAMLMAIWLNGMSIEESAALTKVMLESGDRLNWSQYNVPVIDKHSTGGVGDKTSLIILPLCSLHDVIVPMMSGRGLGHTGGTLDKLEAIPGMNVFPSAKEAKTLAEKNHGVFLGQTGELAPLDKKLYALRDVTATVESIPLITASILSKKLAGGVECLVMDVKFGSGAFMSDLAQANKLAESIQKVGEACGLKISSLVTNMGTPLGTTAGNILEVQECIEVMKGKGPKDTRDLSLALSEEMLVLAFPKQDRNALRKKMEEDLDSGRCFERFCQIIKAQKGDVAYLEDPKKFKTAKLRKDITADRDGYISEINVRELGMSVVALGGGRRRAEDQINPSVGLSHLKEYGALLKRGDLLATIHADDEAQLAKAERMVKAAYKLSDTKPVAVPLIERTFLHEPR